MYIRKEKSKSKKFLKKVEKKVLTIEVKSRIIRHVPLKGARENQERKLIEKIAELRGTRTLKIKQRTKETRR